VDDPEPIKPSGDFYDTDAGWNEYLEDHGAWEVRQAARATATSAALKPR